MDPIRESLRQRREAAAAEVETLERDLRALFEASRAANADDEHDPEGATIGFERAQLTALLAAERRHVVECDEALARLDAGGYGRCERCGTAIPAERLEALPSARRCVTCAGTSRSR